MDSSHKTTFEHDGVTPVKNVTLEEMMPLICAQLAAGRSVRIYPRGTSMLPMLVEGRDSVVLSPLPDRLKRYDLPLYQRKNGQFVLHRVVKIGETYTCLGDNQFVFEEGLSHDQMIAVVASFIRNGKEYRVTDLSYRFYRVFWFRSRHIRRFGRRCMGGIRRLLGKK